MFDVLAWASAVLVLHCCGHFEMPMTGVGCLQVAVLVRYVCSWEGHLLVCRLSIGGDGVQVLVFSMGCLVAIAHGWFVVAFGRAVFCVVHGIARPPVLSPCNTNQFQRNIPKITSCQQNLVTMC